MHKLVKWEAGFMSCDWGKSKQAHLLSYVGTPHTQCASHQGNARYSIGALLLGHGRKQKVIFCIGTLLVHNLFKCKKNITMYSRLR
jgi:hypothetical protein